MCADMMHELSLYQVVSYRLIKFFLPVEEVLISLCSSFVLGMAAANEKYRNILRSDQSLGGSKLHVKLEISSLHAATWP